MASLTGCCFVQHQQHDRAQLVLHKAIEHSRAVQFQHKRSTWQLDLALYSNTQRSLKQSLHSTAAYSTAPHGLKARGLWAALAA